VPYSIQTFAGGAAGINLAVSIPFLLRAHVCLYTNYDQSLGTYSALLVEGTNYNWVSDASITMLTATTGSTITLKRKTPTTSLLVGWTDGSNVDMDDLLTADRQNFYAVQEQEDASTLALANAGSALTQVGAALGYNPVGTVAAIPTSPTNAQRIEISNSTGIESFSPLTGKPSGFIGASNLTVRLVYTTTGNTWQWVDYRPVDPDNRYGTIASVTAAATAAATAQTTANNAAAAATAAVMPSGFILPFAGSIAPTGWLKANGQAVSRTTYAALFAAISTTWGAGDGSTTFNVPDLRGEFVRGLDDGKGTDPGRTLSSTPQLDSFKSHTHGSGWIRTDSEQVGQGTTASSIFMDRIAVYSAPGGTPTGATGGGETRPRNIALLYCIKT
jgi:microcystin-dependent protein